MTDARSWRSPEIAGMHVTRVAIGLTVGLAVTAGVLAVADRGVGGDLPVPEPESWFVPVQIASAAIWIVASLSLRQRRDLWWSALCGIAGLSHAIGAAAHAWAVHGLVAGEPAIGATRAAGASWVLAIEVPITIHLLTSLPTGHLPAGRGSRLARAALLAAWAGVVVSAVSRPDTTDTDFAAARDLLGLDLPTGPLPALLLAPAALAGIVVLLLNWRRSTEPTRSALRFVALVQLVATVIVVPTVALAPPAVGVGIAQVASAIGIASLVWAIRRGQLLGVQRLFDRTLRFLLPAGALAALYAAVVAVGAEILGGTTRPVAAAVVALAVLPARDHLTALVARLVYGSRSDPATIVHQAADRNATPASATALLGRFLDDLRVGADASGARVDIDGVGVLVSSGSVDPDRAGTVSLPLVHRGSSVGRLIVSPGPGELCLDDPALRMIDELVPHVAISTAACLTVVELASARQRLVEGREEERRRIRHDLHDGLGPILTGVAFSTDAAVNLCADDPEAAVALMHRARADVATALDEIRRIVEDLRPPALDELGLEGAILQHAARLPQIHVELVGLEADPALPAAVEVAAYRIVSEALTNIARHSAATHCRIALECGPSLCLTVHDNAAGMRAWDAGVGIESMRERARELGGDLEAGPSPTGGLVSASIPVGDR